MNCSDFKRKNTRCSFDYSNSGYYFLTLCTQDKIHYFGEINDDYVLYNIGLCADNYIKELPKIYNNIIIDKYVIMPNHIHMILVIKQQNDLNVSKIIKRYKELVTKRIGKKIWQKSYYDHVIRDEDDYWRIWKYIDDNILKWKYDKYY